MKHKEVASKLLAYGANPDIENQKRFTARQNAPRDWADLFSQRIDKRIASSARQAPLFNLFNPAGNDMRMAETK